jgi:hypothetical protein
LRLIGGAAIGGHPGTHALTNRSAARPRLHVKGPRRVVEGASDVFGASLACSAVISSAGAPSTTVGQSFVIRGDRLRNNKVGLLFFGVNGRATIPFHGGTLCAAPPLTRTPLRSTGGNAAPADDCTGQLALDFNGWLWDQPLLSEFRLPGTQFQCQWWARDPNVASTTVFSNALEFTLGL